ncbi:hypothetical protein CHS0354_006867 [Potamilus streckersoni]|uniref:Homoserine dehydrogenase n=1 Tax=Potamilus streckersoni TaxID=2493646 RepID=A0AAE0TED2_9BIVA|nr:hypothetical protein CHS0354_006867 [Potamilus streckersoni]
MKSRKQIKLGIFGLGSVGQGVVRQLHANREKIQAASGAEIILYKACVRNPDTSRNIPDCGLQISADPAFILNDPEVDICIELVGGVDIARKVILSCLRKGTPVITANKHLLAEYGAEIFTAAAETGTFLGFEASVCGGIPVIKTIRESYAGDNITDICGILNGTSNYSLSSMSGKELSFENALKEAQKLGYAEADPTFDVQGYDAAHKLIIMMGLAFNRLFDFRALTVRGIADIDIHEMRCIHDLGYEIKLIGYAAPTQDGYEAALSPMLLSREHLLASVNNSLNAVTIESEYAGINLLYGKGAGGYPTANSVITDLIDAVCLIQHQSSDSSVSLDTMRRFPHKPYTGDLSLKSPEPYYLNFRVKDETGVLAKIAGIISDNNISVSQEPDEWVQEADWETGSPTQRLYRREVVHEHGIPHLAANLWAVCKTDGKDYVYFQKRAADKINFPNLYDAFAGGHLTDQETPEQCIIRETYEETGISPDILRLTCFLKRRNILQLSGYFDMEWLLHYLLVTRDAKDFSAMTGGPEVSGFGVFLLPELIQLFERRVSEINGIYFDNSVGQHEVKAAKRNFVDFCTDALF